MQINKKKLKRQVGIVNKVFDLGGSGTVMAVTGFGKTYLSILWYKEHCRRHNSKLRLHVVVPRTKLKEDWTTPNTGHIDVHGLDRNYVDVFVVNTYVKEARTTDLVIYDEVHRYLNPEAEHFSKALTLPYKDFALGLSATLTRQEIDRLEEDFNMPLADKVTLAEALNEGYVAEHKVFNVPLQLGEAEELEYHNIDSEFKRHFRYFNFNFDLATQCLNFNGAVRFSKQRGGNPQNVNKMAVQFYRYMHARKQFLYNAKSKRDLAAQRMDQCRTRKPAARAVLLRSVQRRRIGWPVRLPRVRAHYMGYAALD